METAVARRAVDLWTPALGDQPALDIETSGNPVALRGWIAQVLAWHHVFFLQNGEEQKIDFLIFEKDTTIRWSLLVAVVLGILVDRIFTMWWRRRRKRNNNE